MESYLQTYGLSKTIVDGNVIDDVKWNAIYDGEGVDLEATRNDKSIYMQLDNDEIMKLFELPSNHKKIHERLEDDLHNHIKVLPIIIEEQKTHHKHHSKTHDKHRSKTHHKHHSKTHDKHHSKTHHKHHSKTHHKHMEHSKSKSKGTRSNKSKRTRSNKSKSTRKSTRKITPDYLKTIY